LAEAQKDLVTEAFFPGNTSDGLPELRKRFDRMLCIVVVPWDPVVTEYLSRKTALQPVPGELLFRRLQGM